MSTWGAGGSRIDARRAHRWVYDRRRLISAGLAALAGYLGVSAARPEPERTVGVLVAAKDLAAGHRLGPGDVRMARWPVLLVPRGRLESADGQALMAPVRRGEPLTDVRVSRGHSYPAVPAGMAVVTVRLADAAAVQVASPGSRVDVIVAGPPGTVGVDDQGSGHSPSQNSSQNRNQNPGDDPHQKPGQGQVVASDALVLARSEAVGDPSGGADDSLVLVLAVPKQVAIRLAALAGTTTFAVITSTNR